MTFEKYYTAFVKKWPIVLICFIIIGGGTLGGSLLMPPLYQSTALIQIQIHSTSGSVIDINSLLASNQLVQTEATLATSDSILREVASHYQGLTVERLAKEVSATAKLNTQLFEISVLDADPSLASDLANDVAATLIKQQLHLLQPDLSPEGSFLLVVQAAQPATKPAQPNIQLNTAAGCLAGLLLGILLALMLEQIDSRVRSSDEINALLNWPILTTIWKANPQEMVNTLGQDLNAESYRMLRTNIGLSIIDKPLQSLLVTSASAREGKSVIAANLAIFMARAGKNTLLVDADLRQPEQDHYFNLPANSAGLSDAVMAYNMLTTANSFLHQQFVSPFVAGRRQNTSAQSFTIEPFLHTVGVPNLRIMPAGTLPPNPPELLASKALEGLMAAITNSGAEVVIVDTPPLLGLSDASILMPMIDATLFVIDISHAKRKELKQAKTLLTQSGTHVPGCVINKQRPGRGDARRARYSRKEPDRLDKTNSKNGITSLVPKTPVIPISPIPEGQRFKSNSGSW